MQPVVTFPFIVVLFSLSFFFIFHHIAQKYQLNLPEVVWERNKQTKSIFTIIIFCLHLSVSEHTATCYVKSSVTHIIYVACTFWNDKRRFILTFGKHLNGQMQIGFLLYCEYWFRWVAQHTHSHTSLCNSIKTNMQKKILLCYFYWMWCVCVWTSFVYPFQHSYDCCYGVQL